MVCRFVRIGAVVAENLVVESMVGGNLVVENLVVENLEVEKLVVQGSYVSPKVPWHWAEEHGTVGQAGQQLPFLRPEYRE